MCHTTYILLGSVMHDRVLYNDTQTITDINRDYTPALVTLAGFIFYSDSFVLFGENILHNLRINCLKSCVRLWLFEGKSGPNEQLIKMRGDYVLICKGISHLFPCILIHNPLAFQLAFHKEKIHKCFLEILNTKIKLSCVSFAPHSRIFLVVGSLISTARTTVRNWTASLKFYSSSHGKVFRSLTSHPKLVYWHEDI